MSESSESHQPQPHRAAILHVCKREMLRPLRDEILRISGYDVDSTLSIGEALSMFAARPYALVLIDVEGERGVPEAEQLCSDIKTLKQEQLVAFVCNWRVAILTDCPDEIVRTEFDPAAFVRGVQTTIAKTNGQSPSRSA
jgi:DNA-binding response OmpR family regulator